MDIIIPAPAFVPDIGQIDLCDKIIYIVDVVHRIGFIPLANVFIHQISNF